MERKIERERKRKSQSNKDRVRKGQKRQVQSNKDRVKKRKRAKDKERE